MMQIYSLTPAQNQDKDLPCPPPKGKKKRKEEGDLARWLEWSAFWQLIQQVDYTGQLHINLLQI